MTGRMRWWLAAVVVLFALAVGGWFYYVSHQQQTATPAPKPVYTDDTQSPKNEPGSPTYTSRRGVTLKLYYDPKKAPLTSPYLLTGEVPGNWSFEATFPVELLDSSGKTLVKEPAHLRGDWMTSEYVMFTVTLTFAQPAQAEAGKLILHKDNPSGLEDKADEVVIPVQLAGQK